jgi:hypothetical protein
MQCNTKKPEENMQQIKEGNKRNKTVQKKGEIINKQETENLYSAHMLHLKIIYS